ncbi:M24 family metallopeptidase [Brevibacillus sp. NRS-1366]|uniref:M24 family metallopeptidase n=1 Tax=Brevibacillus sp. NRS-1366 TaxID=3233899 RepID=UPI003D262DA1
MSNRLKKIRNSLSNLGVDAFITGNKANRRYLSGFTGSAGHVIISMDQAALITDFRYLLPAAKEAPDFTIVHNHRDPITAIYEFVRKIGVTKIAIEEEWISLAEYKRWKSAFSGIMLVPTSGIVESLRKIKDEDELDKIKKAINITEGAFAHILGFIQPGVREIDVAVELETFIRGHGAVFAFETIVASGTRGALPHGSATSKCIEAGEMVTLDFGVFFEGYCSDLTRTIAVGEPSEQMREIYEVVRLAQQIAIRQLRPGMTAQQLDLFSREVIEKAGYAEHTHKASGHSIGLDVHEAPIICTSDVGVIEKGMVLTIEPGIYMKGVGGVRIEDDVLVTDNGCETLTNSPNELLILPVGKRSQR